jgi:CDP-6-deoxy-D-xylo-4-hexulose-3-dehydrase
VSESLGAFYSGKTVLVTGHTGFKGGWLSAWLKILGANVVGIGLAPETDRPSLFAAAELSKGMISLLQDIRDLGSLIEVFTSYSPDLVFHLAAQSLVRRSYREPVETYSTNVMGTVHVLEAVRRTPSVRAAVIVTSDKCYDENRSMRSAHREDDPMGGRDPYSSSKGCAELISAAYRRSFHAAGTPTAIASARAGNVIGGGDWADDRLVPDLMRGASRGTRVTIRNPSATRPWQQVLEPLLGYLMLGRALSRDGAAFAEGWNFGPDDNEATSVLDLARRIEREWGHIALDVAPPATGEAYEALDLRLNCSKARERLGWAPILTLDDAVGMTVDWYRAFFRDPGATPDLVEEQIREYTQRLAVGAAVRVRPGSSIATKPTAGDRIRVAYGQSVHGEEEIAAVVEVLRTSTQMGRRVRAFEADVATLFAKKHGVMVNSGSSANYLAVELLGLDEGSEVITPALTFSTTVAPLVQHGLVPSFVDVEEGTYNIDVAAIEARITPRTRALMIPSLIGNLPDWDQIKAIADRYRLIVVEDSADTLGALLRGTSTGARSQLSTTSFYGSHLINCAGNGGMLCLNDEELCRRAKLLRSWGRSSSLFAESERIEGRFDVELDGIPYDAKFVFESLGYNLEPSELGAAFGLVQLKKLGANIEARLANFESHLVFFRRFADWFVLPRQIAESRTGWLAFPLTVRDDAPFTRRELQIFFEKRNIQTRTVFTGNVLRQPGFAAIERRDDPRGYPQADRVMRGGLLVGCHHGLDHRQIAAVHEAFEEFASRVR